MPPTSSAGRCATRCAAASRRTGTSPPRPCPEVTQALFHGSVYENAFGTVAVRTDDPAIGEVEITTFRSDHDYADHRRPHRVEFTDSIDLDLARRDFTVNAIAWGAESGARPAIVDPHRGLDDLATRDAPRRRRSRRPGSRRTRSAWSARCASRRRSSSRSSLRRWRPSRRVPSSSGTCRASGSPTEMRRLLAAAHAVGRAPPAGRHGTACASRAGAGTRSAACPRTRSRARTSGITRCARSMAPSSTRPTSDWPRCSTTSASPRRWPTAGSSAMRPPVPRWRATCSSAGAGRRPSVIASSC